MENCFQLKGYKYLKNLLDTSNLYSYINKVSEKGLGHIDTQVKDSRAFYKDAVFEKLLEILLPVIEEHCGCKVYKTYSFARMYKLGDVLEPHCDRESCEITVSLALGHEGDPWPIQLMDRDQQPQSFILQPGDALMFKGIDLMHWRDENVFGGCSQVFLHYVDQNGPYADCRDDQKAKVLGTEAF